MDAKTFTQACDLVEKQDQISKVLGLINNRGEGEILQLFWGKTRDFNTKFVDLPDHILDIIDVALRTEFDRLKEEFKRL